MSSEESLYRGGGDWNIEGGHHISKKLISCETTIFLGETQYGRSVICKAEEGVNRSEHSICSVSPGGRKGGSASTALQAAS